MTTKPYRAIVVDSETYKELANRSLPFESPNATLRRIFGLPIRNNHKGRPKGSKNKPKAP